MLALGQALDLTEMLVFRNNCSNIKYNQLQANLYLQMKIQ